MKLTINFVTYAILLIMLTTPSFADFNFKNPCHYSGNQRDELSKILKSQLIGKPVDDIKDIAGADWAIKAAQTPEFLVRPNIFDSNHPIYKNTEKISFIPLTWTCLNWPTQKRFFIYVEFKSNKITDADIEVIYIDINFWKRGEDLNWRRYGTETSYLQAALRSIQEHVSTVKEWKEILSKAGYVEVPDCKRTDQNDEIIYWIPWYPPGSLVHKYGGNITPNNRRKVIIKSNGTAMAGVRDCGKEVEKRMIRQYWERF